MYIMPEEIEVENEIIDLNLFNIIGSWKDTYLEIQYHLVKEDNGHGLVKEFDDGSFHMIDISCENCENHCIFSIPDSPNDEFFILTGNLLELRDSKGLIDRFETVL